MSNYSSSPAEFDALSACSPFLGAKGRPTELCLHFPNDFAWYYSPASSQYEQFSDPILALMSPVVCYWIASLFFHIMDLSESPYVAKHRIHPSEDEKRRNLVTKSTVFFMVVVQQVIQTLLGLAVLDEGKRTTVDQAFAGMSAWMSRLEPWIAPLIDERSQGPTLVRAAYIMYWWIIPSFQFLFAMFVLDSWQYFFHRLFHVNTYLYKNFHSYHHRLYVPYAFGALYNHPLEGFLFDSVGSIVAELASFMTTRQAALLFGISALKTVDDHCGYTFPWDILQWASPNNADYHDIHHQVIGIKSNFSQPFFIHWDYLLSTRMTRDDIQKRRGKMAQKVE